MVIITHQSVCIIYSSRLDSHHLILEEGLGVLIVASMTSHWPDPVLRENFFQSNCTVARLRLRDEKRSDVDFVLALYTFFLLFVR